jgi:uncharacterized protein DUF6445
MPADALFAFNPDAGVEVVRIGRVGIDVMLIDNVLREPESVATLGFAQPYACDPGNLYPGWRAPMPETFSIAFRAWLTPILQRTIERDTSFFSVVATPSADLLPLQRIPHFDSTDPKLFAAVIYLCDGARFAGTAFYRHRRTGYEEITTGNVNDYRLALNADLRAHGAPPREYISGDTALFETVFANELKFNGAIVYPARALHAAQIGQPFTAPKDPADWRLTITALIHVI